MRVVAGSLKSRRLKTPSWEGLRPTSDKLRETLFNILAPRIAGARVLDGFAGTGALGIEAISRGAREVTFIENDARAQALVAENLAACGIECGYTVIRAAVAPALERERANPAFVPFDVVLLDPPYDVAPVEALAGAETVLAPDGVLVLEHAKKQHAPDIAGRLVRQREVRSGDSALTFYRLGR
jgi:16S rRNA (guanine(966)-N(2))-methyltransferase RsmD